MMSNYWQPTSTAPKYLALQDSMNNTYPASLVGCINPAASSFGGMGDGVYVGPPAVLAPTMNTKWFVNQSATISWDTTGRDATLPYQIRLLQNSSCQSLVREPLFACKT